MDSWTEDESGTFRRITADGGRWAVKFISRQGWVMSFNDNPCDTKCKALAEAFRLAAERDECRI